LKIKKIYQFFPISINPHAIFYFSTEMFNGIKKKKPPKHRQPRPPMAAPPTSL
jgi:hypothetical protein